MKSKKDMKNKGKDMKSNRITFLLIILVVLFVITIIIYAMKYHENPIGGDTDEFGCLIGAGYLFDEEVGACIRNWELDENQKTAARVVVEPLSYPVTITEVKVLKCMGCFDIGVQRNDNQERFTVYLRDWEINKEPSNQEQEKNYCAEESRNSEVCTFLYDPVCGWFSEETQCVKYPCAQTYSNSCVACLDEKVLYWTQGKCEE